MEEPLRELIQQVGKDIHNQYLHRRTCPYEITCLKNYLEANCATLFENPELARIAIEFSCTTQSENPDKCPYHLATFEKHSEITALIIINKN